MPIRYFTLMLSLGLLLSSPVFSVDCDKDCNSTCWKPGDGNFTINKPCIDACQAEKQAAGCPIPMATRVAPRGLEYQPPKDAITNKDALRPLSEPVSVLTSRAPSEYIEFKPSISDVTTSDVSGHWIFKVPHGYSYCTHKVVVTSASPRDQRMYWVTRLPDGIRVDYEIPKGTGWINGFFGPFGGTTHWFFATIKLVGWKTGLPYPTSRVSTRSSRNSREGDPFADTALTYCHFPAEDQVVQPTKRVEPPFWQTSACDSRGLIGRTVYSVATTREVACVRATNEAMSPGNGLFFRCSEACRCAPLANKEVGCEIDAYFSQ